MANLISKATSNFTTDTTWGGVATSTGATQLVRTASTTSTTSYVYSPAFTLTNALVIEGVLLYVQVTALGDKTFSVTLSEDNGVTATREVAVNISDIASAITQPSWVFFKFGSTLTADGGADYKIGIKHSSTGSAGSVNVFRNGAADWTRMCRLNTNVTPVAADALYIVGDLTGAATGNDFTVTMNETATTDYGLINIGKRGILQYGTSAVDYYLKTSGIMEVFNDGTLNIGTSGTPIPSTASAVLEIDCTSNVEFGLELRAGSITNVYGASKTVRAVLTADTVNASASVTTDVSTAWKSGDVIMFPSTSRTAADAQTKILNGDASGTGLTTTVAFGAVVHSGTSPTAATIANLTRNVKIRGISSSFQSYINIAATAVVNMQYAEIYQMGSATATKRGIDCATTTGVCNIQYCSLHDFTATSSLGFNVTTASGTGVTVSNNVFYNIVLAINVAGVAVKTFDSNIICRSTLTGGFASTIPSDIVTNNISSSNTGVGFQVVLLNGTIGTFSGNTAHSNSSVGFLITGVLGTLSNLTSWRNNTNNYQLVFTGVGEVTYDTLIGFGALTSNIFIGAVDNGGLVLFKSATLNAGTTLTCPVGVSFQAGMGYDTVLFEDCSFGATTTHSTGDFLVPATITGRILLRNTVFASTTEISVPTNLPQAYAFPGIASMDHDGAAGTHKTWFRNGVMSTDTAFYRTASPSVRLSPTSASAKLLGAFGSVKVNSGDTVTVSAYVRESIAGDGTDYNGARPRLMVRRNPLMGITADTALDTATNLSEGDFELLTGTTVAASANGVMEFYIDCDGTTGWVNVDDFTTTSNNSPSGMKYWDWGMPQLEGLEYNAGAGSSEHSFAFCQ